MSLKIQTKSDLLPNSDHGSQNLKESLIEAVPFPSMDTPPSYKFPILNTSIEDIPQKDLICSPIDIMTEDNELETIMDTQLPIVPASIEPRLNYTTSLKQFSEPICCPCGALNYDSEFAMIFCDTCRTWQHTVCCGYFSNSDKRIPNEENSTRTCYNCQFKTKHKVLKFCSDLSLFRLALFITFNDSTIDNFTLTRQLGINWQKASRILKKLTTEGFLLKNPQSGTSNKYSYECIKNNDVKKKIKHYFTLNLENFPEYHRAAGRIITSNRKKADPSPSFSIFTDRNDDQFIDEASKSEHNIHLLDKVDPSFLRDPPSSKKRKQSSGIDYPLKCSISN